MCLSAEFAVWTFSWCMCGHHVSLQKILVGALCVLSHIFFLLHSFLLPLEACLTPCLRHWAVNVCHCSQTSKYIRNDSQSFLSGETSPVLSSSLLSLNMVTVSSARSIGQQRRWACKWGASFFRDLVSASVLTYAFLFLFSRLENLHALVHLVTNLMRYVNLLSI